MADDITIKESDFYKLITAVDGQRVEPGEIAEGNPAVEKDLSASANLLPSERPRFSVFRLVTSAATRYGVKTRVSCCVALGRDSGIMRI